MKPTMMPLDEAARFPAVLERIRAGADRLDIDDVGAWDEDERVRRLARPLLCQSGLTRVGLVVHDAFVREMCRLLRTKDGPGLAQALELLVTKWALRDLEPVTLKAIIVHCYDALSVPARA